MGCINSDWNGKCSMFEEGTGDDHTNSAYGWDSDGYCVVDDDPVPSDNCCDYETDSGCRGCGADFNADEECEC